MYVYMHVYIHILLLLLLELGCLPEILNRMLESIGKAHESQRKCWNVEEGQGKSDRTKENPRRRIAP